MIPGAARVVPAPGVGAGVEKLPLPGTAVDTTRRAPTNQ